MKAIEPVMSFQWPTMGHCYMSKWKPSWRERIGLLFGRCIWVRLLCDRAPPLCVDCESGIEVQGKKVI